MAPAWDLEAVVKAFTEDTDMHGTALHTGLLPLDVERPGEHTQGRASDEPPSGDHWISSSARSSSDGGMVSPSALAVLRLITNSSCVGCSMGRSAGLAPLSILSTQLVGRRYQQRSAHNMRVAAPIIQQ